MKKDTSLLSNDSIVQTLRRALKTRFYLGLAAKANPIPAEGRRKVLVYFRLTRVGTKCIC